MIELTRGDILKADVDALVNTVNCVGVMGRGIALQFRKAFPRNFDVYKAACEREEVQPGRMLVVDLGMLQGPRYVVNFPTKRHWKGKSRLEDVRSGLDALVEEIRNRGIDSIAIPPLGCGLGGLEWALVRPLIESAFAALPDVRVLLYEPAGAPAAESMARSTRIPEMTVGRASLIGLMRRYLAAVMDPHISLLEIHKLMYFMQEAGEPLRLQYVKGRYGPYSENLRHVLNLLEGHFISGFGDAEDDPQRRIELQPNANDVADRFLYGYPDTLARFRRVEDLIRGFETSYGMELLATTHWVARYENGRGEDRVVSGFHAWNDRKRRFAESHIRQAWRRLATTGWLTE